MFTALTGAAFSLHDTNFEQLAAKDNINYTYLRTNGFAALLSRAQSTQSKKKKKNKRIFSIA